MKNRIMLFAFLSLILSQSLIKTQLEIKQFLNNNKVHCIYGGVILALLCGSWYFIRAKNHLSGACKAKSDEIINKLNELKEEIAKKDQEIAQLQGDVDDYHKLSICATIENQQKKLFICFNNTGMLIDCKSDQKTSMYDTVQQNKKNPPKQSYCFILGSDLTNKIKQLNITSTDQGYVLQSDTANLNDIFNQCKTGQNNTNVSTTEAQSVNLLDFINKIPLKKD